MSEQLTERGTYFSVILYPNEDVNHSSFLTYVMEKPMYEVCYILHYPDFSDDDDEIKDESHNPKKEHIHCVVHVKKKLTVSSFLKYFDPWIKYAKCLHSPDAYLMYMLHQTPKSITAGKTPYDISDFKGDRKMWKNLEQNSNFVQLREFFRFMHEGDTLLDIIKRIEDSGVDPSPYVDYLHTNSFLLVSVCNQEMNKYYKELQFLRKEVFS